MAASITERDPEGFVEVSNCMESRKEKVVKRTGLEGTAFLRQIGLWLPIFICGSYIGILLLIVYGDFLPVINFDLPDICRFFVIASLIVLGLGYLNTLFPFKVEQSQEDNKRAAGMVYMFLSLDVILLASICSLVF